MRRIQHLPKLRAATALSLIALALTTACNAGAAPDAGEVVATAGDAVLTRGDLTALLSRSPIPPTEALAFGLTSAWIDHALVLQHLDALDSDQIFAAATVQPRIDSLTQRLISSRIATARAATPAEVDSVARRGDVHVFRMYAIAVVPGDTLAQTEGSAILMGLRSAALAATNSPDVPLAQLPAAARAKVTVKDFPATTRDGLPPDLASHIWGLGEGEISMPLQNLALLQMYYRVPRPEANKALSEWTRLALQERNDATMIDSLIKAKNFAVPDDISERMRGVFNEPGAITGTAPVATWQGGETTPDEALAWIRTIPAQIRAQQITASDKDLADLAAAAGRREVLSTLLGQVDTTGVATAMRGVFDNEIALIEADANRVATGKTTSERAFNWSTAETELKVPYRSEPRGLGAALRSLTPVDVDAVRVRSALGEAVRVWQAPGTPPPATPSVP